MEIPISKSIILASISKKQLQMVKPDRLKLKETTTKVKRIQTIHLPHQHPLTLITKQQSMLAHTKKIFISRCHQMSPKKSATTLITPWPMQRMKKYVATKKPHPSGRSEERRVG